MIRQELRVTMLMPSRWRPAVPLAAFLLLLAGCAGAPVRSPALADCEARFQTVDSQLRAAGLIDAQTRRIPGFPYLRVNRFLASYADEPLDKAAFSAWVARLRGLARHGRAIELALLYADPMQAQAAQAYLDDCAARMRAADMASARRRSRLRERARVPDDYRDTTRIAGLYPLAVPVLKTGVARWRARMQAAFDQPQAAAQSLTRTYTPNVRKSRAQPSIADWLAAARARNPLGIPDLSADRLASLERYFAPVWQIDTMARYDRPGAPYRGHAGPAVDVDRPWVYVQPSYTRFDGAVLLQLTYVLWFSKRPERGWIDPLAGTLDGVFWRVTLDVDGTPLLYDTIHPCGCYQMFFPTHRLRRGSGDGFWAEGALVPATAPTTVPVQVHLASATHYVRGVRRSPSPPAHASDYALVSYDALRRQQPRLFDNNGLVSGTQRAERWLLWPSGVVSPGAMRQWGHHATAFVGERHFDDPFLIGRYFKRAR